MSLWLERFREMLGFSPKPKQNYIGPDVSKAIQRNEQANVNARRALEDLKMADTIKEIAEKMK